MDDKYFNEDILRAAHHANRHLAELLPGQEGLRFSDAMLPETLAMPEGFKLKCPAEFLLRAVIALIAPSMLSCVDSICLSVSNLHASSFKAMIIESLRPASGLRRYARAYRPANSK